MEVFMLEERAAKLVDNTFINEFLEKGLNSDEQFYGVKKLQKREIILKKA